MAGVRLLLDGWALEANVLLHEPIMISCVIDSVCWYVSIFVEPVNILCVLSFICAWLFSVDGCFGLLFTVCKRHQEVHVTSACVAESGT